MKGIKECPRCVRDDADVPDPDLLCEEHLPDYADEVEGI